MLARGGAGAGGALRCKVQPAGTPPPHATNWPRRHPTFMAARGGGRHDGWPAPTSQQGWRGSGRGEGGRGSTDGIGSVGRHPGDGAPAGHLLGALVVDGEPNKVRGAAGEHGAVAVGAAAQVELADGVALACVGGCGVCVWGGGGGVGGGGGSGRREEAGGVTRGKGSAGRAGRLRRPCVQGQSVGGRLLRIERAARRRAGRCG